MCPSRRWMTGAPPLLSVPTLATWACAGACARRAVLSIPHTSYELPDGTQLDVGAERFKATELFFDPSPLHVTAGPSSGAAALLCCCIFRGSKRGLSCWLAGHIPRRRLDSERSHPQRHVCGFGLPT